MLTYALTYAGPAWWRYGTTACRDSVCADVCADVCRTRLAAAQRRSMSRRRVCAGLRAHSRPALTSSSLLPSPLPSRLSRSATTGTQFTCFTGTKVQILTHLRQAHPCHAADYCSLHALLVQNYRYGHRALHYTIVFWWQKQVHQPAQLRYSVIFIKKIMQI